MDALAAYGSDDSSSSTSSSAKVPKSKQPKSSNENGGKKSTKNGDKNQANSPLDAAAIPSASSPPPKRPRRWDQPASNNCSSSLLPPPPLANSNDDCDSMILWQEDYLLQQARNSTHAKTPIVGSARLAEQLQAKTAALIRTKQEKSPSSKNDGKHSASTTTTTWPSLLQSTHEFHNPRFLEHVAHSCGITMTMGSTLENAEAFQDFEFRLVELEEKARVKTYEDQQQQHDSSSSYFAQNQLSQALQRHSQR